MALSLWHIIFLKFTEIRRLINTVYNQLHTCKYLMPFSRSIRDFRQSIMNKKSIINTLSILTKSSPMTNWKAISNLVKSHYVKTVTQ